jgi:hypothetical protein
MEDLKDKFIFYVLAPEDRPDFRQVMAFLWGEDQDVDSDGDSYPVSSRTWTELTLITRDDREEKFDVDPCGTAPLVLRVESDSHTLAARVAYLLAHHTGGEVGQSPSGPFYESASLIAELGEDFDLDVALHRFHTTKYARSTLANPYPK